MQKKNPIIIKKYPNRRLYNTAISSYITLEDLANLIKQGEEVTIIDANGKDITHLTLVQVILEYQSLGYQLLPLNCLKQVIKHHNHYLSKVLLEYLSMSTDYFQKNQQYIELIMSSMACGEDPANIWAYNLQLLKEQNENFMQMANAAMSMFHSSDKNDPSGSDKG